MLHASLVVAAALPQTERAQHGLADSVGDGNLLGLQPGVRVVRVVRAQGQPAGARHLEHILLGFLQGPRGGAGRGGEWVPHRSSCKQLVVPYCSTDTTGWRTVARWRLHHSRTRLAGSKQPAMPLPLPCAHLLALLGRQHEVIASKGGSGDGCRRGGSSELRWRCSGAFGGSTAG
ncbi:hypothetical protein ABPG75_007718 [Micractinium tetrahymenae]